MADDAAAWRGRIIDDRYEVDDVLGRGGMGVVLRAHHKFTGAAVAIKVLRAELAGDPELQRRFLREARASNAIGHPGIVQIFDAGRDAAGELYMVMELLEGVSLRVPIARGQLGAPEVRRIGLELIDALGAAHAHGVIHRDLKPENVFLVAPGGAVKLLDFGIAKVVAAKPSTVGATAAGVLLGTVAYMAPEQLEDARAVDPRSDLWAVGVMLYEMLSGRLPFDAYTPQALFVAVATAEPVSIRVPMPNAPPALVGFFTRALARNPQQRFGSAAELAAALSALPLGNVPSAPGRPAAAAPSVIASGFAPAPVPPPSPVHAPAAAPRSRRGPILIGAAVVVALAAVAVAYVETQPTSPVARPIDAAVLVAAPPPLLPAPAPPPPPPPPPVDAAAPLDAAAKLVTVAVRPAPPDAATPSPPPPLHVAPAASPACTAACAALAGCGLVMTRALCDATCAEQPSFAACVEAVPANSCTAIAKCSFTATCGRAPSGSVGCGDTLGCVAGCNSDPSCICKCNIAAKPGMEWMIGKTEVCRAECNAVEGCMDNSCPGWRGCLER